MCATNWSILFHACIVLLNASTSVWHLLQTTEEQEREGIKEDKHKLLT
jgi:hypothetical protein